MAINVGDVKTKKLTTGRLYLKRTGESSFIDLGNVVDYKYEPDRQRFEHQSSSGGLKRHDFALVKSVKERMTLNLDEMTSELRKLMHLGTQAADVTQASGNVTAEVLCTTSSKQGRTYFAQAQGLSAVVVKVGAATKVEGTDYTVDLGSGAITILNGGTIADNSTVTVDYTKAEVTTAAVTALKELRVTGDFRFLETDQHTEVPRATWDFKGQCQVTGWGENNTDNATQVALEVLMTNAPVVKYRRD